jgi:hypothetical protein
MLKSGFLILFICLSFTGCGEQNQQIQKAQISELDSVDYQIISTAIREYFYPSIKIRGLKEFIPKQFNTTQEYNIILFSDLTLFQQPKNHVTDHHYLLDSNDWYLTYRLNTENQKRFKIDSNIVKPQLINKLLRIVDLSSGNYKYDLDGFFPIRYGISKPSYSENRKRAVIYFSFGSYDEKWERLLWYKKEDNIWKVYDIVEYY